jgi:hypothetical protein
LRLITRFFMHEQSVGFTELPLLVALCKRECQDQSGLQK